MPRPTVCIRTPTETHDSRASDLALALAHLHGAVSSLTEICFVSHGNRRYGTVSSVPPEYTVVSRIVVCVGIVDMSSETPD